MADDTPQDKVLEHEYDGIRELDNNLPRWWLWLFYFTVIFSVIYMLYFHVFRIGYSQEEKYQASINENYEREVNHNPLMLLVDPYHPPWYSPERDKRRAQLEAGMAVAGPTGGVTRMEVTFDAPLEDPAALAIGQKIYVAQCVLCHADDGSGTPSAPNLTDDTWIHGGEFNDIVNIIVHGEPAKGMIAWGDTGKLNEAQIHQVASYIEKEIKGKNLPGSTYGQ